MTGRTIALLFATALLAGAFGLPEPGAAQCRLCATPDTRLDADAAGQAIRLEVQARLDFDQIVLTGGQGTGTARLLPDGSSSTSGTIEAIGGRAMVGHVRVRGEPGRLVRIGMPGSVVLYGLSGSSIRLDALVTDLPSQPRLDSQGTLQFRFGGAIHVEGEADGDFRGDVPVTVDYL